MREIAFRGLSVDDLQQVFLWLLRPHVTKWYAPAPTSFTELTAKYGPRTLPGSPVRAYMIVVDGKDVGYIQAYPLALFPDYAQGLGCDDSVAGIDLFIGEELFLGWGLGSRAIRRFVDEVVFAQPGVDSCVAGPAEGNRASIRAFERAGFRRWKVAANERGETECVMRRERIPERFRLAPIVLPRDLDTCIAFRRDMYLASFGSLEGLDQEMGEADSHYRAQLEVKIAQVPEGNTHLWEGGRIVGQTEMRFDDDPGVGYVSLFYLVPECRAQGLGRMLHEHAVNVFGARACRAIRLSVSTRNATAIAFYRKLGWASIGPRPHKQPMELMEYRLG